MATASKVAVRLDQRPEYCLPDLDQASATKVSELLQENHEQHHTFFNTSGFHNHIAHHLLTVYALAATPQQIQKHYDANKSYQRSQGSHDQSVIQGMHDPAQFHRFLGQEKYYHDYLIFFQDEISKKGWQGVLNEYVFARDERADDMLVRMFAGFLHPIIHLGFGVEFQQPAIIAEALAQAAVHDAWMASLLLEAEKKATTSSKPGKSFVELLDHTHETKALRTAADVDGNRIRDGILKTAASTMIDIVSQYHISDPSQLEECTAEMTNATAYFTAAAQRPTKAVKMDFFYMHCLNSSIFFSAFIKQDWLSRENAMRLLEWKIRTDITLYASRGCPDLLLGEISNYRPLKPTKGPDPWHDIFERVKLFDDDGHAAKLLRALAHGQEICKPYSSKSSFRIKDDMWLKMGHMAIDSIESSEPTWVRSTGFDSAWANIRDRAVASL